MLCPAPGEPLEHAEQVTVSVGGAESNVAGYLARLGHRTTWVSRVGDDPSVGPSSGTSPPPASASTRYAWTRAPPPACTSRTRAPRAPPCTTTGPGRRPPG
ncbi:PfkB family carbohydrate kinase [Micromonospora sp. M12]